MFMSKNNALYKKLSKYSLDDVIGIEKMDRQFIAVSNLYKNKNINDDDYLFLIMANALICYQLSGRGENYWEEFAKVMKAIEGLDDDTKLKNFLINFVLQSKNNKRLFNVKRERIEKFFKFYNTFTGRSKMYYDNMELLAKDLASIMKQERNAKTIVFAIKMFSYGARNVFGYVNYFPTSLAIPLDSRLEKIYLVHVNKTFYTKKDVQTFYANLSKELQIPPLHLDVLLWTQIDI